MEAATSSNSNNSSNKVPTESFSPTTAIDVTGPVDPVLAAMMDATSSSTANNRISTLDACYEAVKEKLERLREEIRRIRINKQQEQLQQSIQAKRFSADSTANTGSSQLLMLPGLSSTQLNGLSPSRLRHHRNSANLMNGNSSAEDTSNDDAAVRRSSSRRQQQQQQQQQQPLQIEVPKSVGKRSPRSMATSNNKPKLSRQNEVNSQNDTPPSGKEGSESPVWVPNGHPNGGQAPSRHKSLNARGPSPSAGQSSSAALGPPMSRQRSRTLRESPHPARLVNEHSKDHSQAGLGLHVVPDPATAAAAAIQENPVVSNGAIKLAQPQSPPAQQQNDQPKSQKLAAIQVNQISEPSINYNNSKQQLQQQSSLTSANNNQQQQQQQQQQQNVDKKFDDALRILSKQQQQQTNDAQPSVASMNGRTFAPHIQQQDFSKEKTPTASHQQSTSNGGHHYPQHQNQHHRLGKKPDLPLSKSLPQQESIDSIRLIDADDGDVTPMSMSNGAVVDERSLVTSTVVLPSQSANAQPSVPQPRRPPRSFTVRTNGTPEYELDRDSGGSGSGNNSGSSVAVPTTRPPPAATHQSLPVSGSHNKTTLPLPTQPITHSMSVSPQRTFAPAGNLNVDQTKCLTPSTLLKHDPNYYPPPPPRLLIDQPKLKSPLNGPPMSSGHAGSTPVLVGAKTGGFSMQTVKSPNGSINNGVNSTPVPERRPQPEQAGMVPNKRITAIVAHQNSLLSNDSSSYENLDQQQTTASGPHSRVRNITSSSSNSSGPVQPFPLPVPPTLSVAPARQPGVNQAAITTLKQISSSQPQQLPQTQTQQQHQQQQQFLHHQPKQQQHAQQQHQRKSAILPSELEKQQQPRPRTFPYQRNSLDVASPSLSCICQDTDSELEGIFGEGAIDDFETSTTMSDSPSFFSSDVNVWPVMIGNNVMATKRRPRTVGHQASHGVRKKDPPRVADAVQAAMIASRRGSLARPRPTAVHANGPINRSSADLTKTTMAPPVVANSTIGQQAPTVTQAPVSSPPVPVPAANQAPPVPAQQAPPLPPHPPPVQPLGPNVVLVPVAESPTKTSISSPKALPMGFANSNMQQQANQANRRPPRSLLGQLSLGSSSTQNPTPPVHMTATQIAAANAANSGKPSVTGLLYGAAAESKANAHMSQYSFRGNAQPPSQPQQQQLQPQQGITRSSVLNNPLPGLATLTKTDQHRPLNGALSLNAPVIGPPPLVSPNAIGGNAAAGQVSIASMIFNHPLPPESSPEKAHRKSAGRGTSELPTTTSSMTMTQQQPQLQQQQQQQPLSDSQQQPSQKSPRHHRHHSHHHHRHSQKAHSETNEGSRSSHRRRGTIEAPPNNSHQLPAAIESNAFSSSRHPQAVVTS